LAIIGSQTILVTFSGKVKAKEAEFKRRQRIMREKRRKEISESDNPADREMSRRKDKPA